VPHESWQESPEFEAHALAGYTDPPHEVDPSLAPSSNGSKPNGSGTRNTAECARILSGVESYAIGGGQLYVHQDGCYRPGARHLGQRIAGLLDSGWSRRKAEEITSYLRATVPELWEEPPCDIINVRNGLLDVATRELSTHMREHLSPVQIAASYDPVARCPQVDKFIASTIPGLGSTLMEIIGLLLIPDNRFQKAIMLLGPGGTGKTTALNMIRALLGSENVSTVALHQLDEHRFATADLYGKLANTFADLPGHALKSSSIFKSITGGDPIRAERKHCPAFSFKPYARLIFSANEAPPTADNSDAFFDRWLILPFDRRYRGTEHEDRDLTAKLTAPGELSGLLNKALDGLDRLRAQGGFTRAASSERAGKRFRIESDSAAGFCEECCEVRQDARVAKPELFKAYREWCAENNRLPLASVRFSRRLRELHKHLDEVASGGTDYWLGIDLR
jgi:putative DNA primase/helicase